MAIPDFLKNPIVYSILVFQVAFCSDWILFPYLLFLLNIASIISQTLVLGSNELKYKLLTDYFMIKNKVPEQ